MSQPILEGLRRVLSEPLPGHDRFMAMSGYERPDVEEALKREPAPRESAVLAMLYPREGMLHTLLMVRPEYDGVHSGQVSFPGGKREEHDADLQATALREFGEETGARPDQVHVLGAMSRVYIPPSRMLVTPFLAYTPSLGVLRPDPEEVAALVEAPLREVLREDILRFRMQELGAGGIRMRVPYFDIRGQVVWGATAMMIAELRELFGRLGHAEHGEELR